VVAHLGAPEEVEFYLEQRVAFPTIASAYGTVDLLVRIGRTIHVIDFKFGSGVRVLALTPDGDTDILNAQLLFYAAPRATRSPNFLLGSRPSTSQSCSRNQSSRTPRWRHPSR